MPELEYIILASGETQNLKFYPDLIVLICDLGYSDAIPDHIQMDDTMID